MSNSSLCSDKDLMEKLKQGDKMAFTTIYQRYHRMIYTLAYRYLKDKSLGEDIVQQVFLKLWVNRKETTIQQSLKNFLYTIAKNLILNEIRRNNLLIQKKYEIAQSQEECENGFIEKLEKEECMGLFYQAVDQLPPQQKKICMLKIKGEFSNGEIAEKLNLSINTIKTHYSEALKKIRFYLNKTLFCFFLFILTCYLSVNL